MLGLWPRARPPLHRQPDFLAFLGNADATLLTSAAPPGVHKVLSQTGNNRNNTVKKSHFRANNRNNTVKIP